MPQVQIFLFLVNVCFLLIKMCFVEVTFGKIHNFIDTCKLISTCTCLSNSIWYFIDELLPPNIDFYISLL